MGSFLYERVTFCLLDLHHNLVCHCSYGAGNSRNCIIIPCKLLEFHNKANHLNIFSTVIYLKFK